MFIDLITLIKTTQMKIVKEEINSRNAKKHKAIKGKKKQQPQKHKPLNETDNNNSNNREQLMGNAKTLMCISKPLLS